jgi:hypothetical protein
MEAFCITCREGLQITWFWIWSWNPWYGSIPHCMQRMASDNCELGEGDGNSHLGHSLDHSCLFHTPSSDSDCNFISGGDVGLSEAFLNEASGMLTQGMLLLLGCTLLTPQLPCWTLGIANVPHHPTARLGHVRLSHVWHTRRTYPRLIIPIWWHWKMRFRSGWKSRMSPSARAWKMSGVMTGGQKTVTTMWNDIWWQCVLSPLISIQLKSRKMVSDGSMHSDTSANEDNSFRNHIR